MSNCSINYFVFSFIIFGLSQLINADNCAAIKTKQCKVEGLIGNQPLQVCRDICMLKTQKSEQAIHLENKRAFLRLFYGPTGNGKTTLAKFYASLTNSEFHEHDGPSIVGQYQGSGAQKIEEIFEDAITAANTSGKRVIIFIDEIDALIASGHNDKNDRIDDYSKTLEKFWCELERYQYDPRIFVIVATNHFEKLPKPFLRRFAGNTIELTNPDQETRVQMILDFLLPLPELMRCLEKFEKMNLEQAQLIDECYLTEHFSVTLNSFGDKLNKWLASMELNSETINREKIHEIIKTSNDVLEQIKIMISKCNELLETNKSDTINTNKIIVIKKCFSCFEQLLPIVIQFFKNEIFIFENINYITTGYFSTLRTKTEGWGNAHLKTLIKNAIEKAELENDGFLTKQIFNEEYELIQKTIITESDRKAWTLSHARDLASISYSLLLIGKGVYDLVNGKPPSDNNQTTSPSQNK